MSDPIIDRAEVSSPDRDATIPEVESSSEIEGHGSLDRKEDRVSSENEGRLHKRSKYNPGTEYSNFPGGGNGERSIGKLCVSRTEIGRGSNGTIVVEGSYEGRAVAVKRMVLGHHEIAYNEIRNLMESDKHPNIVRYYGMEQNDDFMFLALEHAVCSLEDLIQAYSDSPINSFNNPALVGYKKKLDSIRVRMQDVELWRADGHPSPLLLNLMRGVVSGLVHLHNLRLIHHDLRPHNVLITENRSLVSSLVAQLSDMGITKCLPEDKFSLESPATGCGSLGWQAPEQLLHEHQTRAMDMFSLGLVLFFCITRGRHPFGKLQERCINIENNKKDLFRVEFIPEVHDLISRLLEWDYKLRPKASEVLCHPFFWSSEIRLSFFRDTSDRIQLEAERAPNSNFLNELESKAPLVFGKNWDDKIEPIFLANILKSNRRYNYSRLRDLLQVVRNKWSHYIEIPEEVQELLGPVPEDYYNYFTKRFPRLLMESYGVVSQFCKEEEGFRKYFEVDAL
ncbi:serine/threonine-protein kinase/endoribonuclease IRE1a isoform X2 [Eucalyptus grandis]|uniref:serine/threonine-protein kinase/endoribonuclease IRE1a isoform X2 n=1 Tax=Eucalyptus grandis TaxID=71139 RepID=UPI00192E9976|nr:serine/threonine-protein kinase/endoribonuclease IRE1a isoform X2 [Eucalyptus grandis]